MNKISVINPTNSNTLLNGPQNMQSKAYRNGFRINISAFWYKKDSWKIFGKFAVALSLFQFINLLLHSI